MPIRLWLLIYQLLRCIFLLLCPSLLFMLFLCTPVGNFGGLAICIFLFSLCMSLFCFLYSICGKESYTVSFSGEKYINACAFSFLLIFPWSVLNIFCCRLMWLLWFWIYVVWLRIGELSNPPLDPVSYGSSWSLSLLLLFVSFLLFPPVHSPVTSLTSPSFQSPVHSLLISVGVHVIIVHNLAVSEFVCHFIFFTCYLKLLLLLLCTYCYVVCKNVTTCMHIIFSHFPFFHVFSSVVLSPS